MKIVPDAVGLSGTLDLVSSPMQAAPGDARVAVNYEPVFAGGYISLGGYERFDGRERPSDASYQLLVGDFTGVSVGDQVSGQSSEATGVVAALGSVLVLTDVAGEFDVGEQLLLDAAEVGEIVATSASVTAPDDNVYSAAAAEVYRQRISQPPGDGPIRGIAILNDQVYAWRDDGAVCRIYKASPTGWQLIQMLWEVAFSTGSVSPTEGATITRGGVTAVVRRVVVEDGTWSGGDATGRLICEAPSGTFTAGAISAGGTLTLTATLGGQVQRQISLLAGGRVQTEVGNFTAAIATRRLYGCDGLNPEFEFDGQVYVPLNTGMPTRARAVAIHKSRLWFGFENSAQYSGISDPYKWTPLFGAQELGTADPVTNFAVLGGSEENAAMMVVCRDSLHVMYGSTTADFQMIPLSSRRGAQPYSVQDLRTPIGVDLPGLVEYKPTQNFGNFSSELISRMIEPIAKERDVLCSVVVRSLVRYRVFFSDGTGLSCTPGRRGYRFGQLAYDRKMVVAVAGEIEGRERVFYGGEDGFVYEADVGRSFDGRSIDCFLKLAALSQGSPLVEKAYRDGYLEASSQGYVELGYSAEYDDSDPAVSPLLQQSTQVFGAGGVFNVSLFDASYFDARERDRKQLEMTGVGYNIAPIFFSSASNQRQHELSTLTLMVAARRLVR